MIPVLRVVGRFAAEAEPEFLGMDLVRSGGARNVGMDRAAWLLEDSRSA